LTTILHLSLWLRVAAAAVLCGLGTTPAHAQGSQSAYFQFSVGAFPETFVFKLTDPGKIEQARNILAAGREKIISGTIIKQPVYYNAPWSFYFDPKSITFPDFATEVCDANIRFVEDNLSNAFPTWCPWNSRLLREIPSPPKPGGNIPPTISMTFPHTDHSFSSTAYADVTLAAAADDPDGSVSKVEFFSGATKLGESLNHPYRFTWTHLDVGTYTVLASSTDNNGTTTSSRSVTFSITRPTANPIDWAHTFVRQHYIDFLNREPDALGLEYWTSEILHCGSDPVCIHDRRIGVSGAFFAESEFQETGGFLYRLYRATLGQRPQFNQFISERARLSGGPGLELSKESFTNEWVQRPDSLSRYAASLTAEQFVNSLLETVLQSCAVDLTFKRQELVEALLSSGNRARVVKLVVDDNLVRQAEYNGAFVLMQYFGYLRRDPEEGGYWFWLDVLNNRVPNNYRGMICSFLTSSEYQRRFAPLVTRANSDCAL